MSDDDKQLDSAFADLRAREAPPSRDFLERVLADAAEAMPGQPEHLVRQTARPWYHRLFDGLGGWRGGAALTASAVFGLALGLSGAADDLAISAVAFGDEVSFEDGYSGLFDEGLGEG